MTRLYEFDDLGGPEALKLRDREVPPPGPDEVQVEMKAAGLNRAELLFLQGQYLTEPILPRARVGMEGAGVVRAVGATVIGITPGDRVAVTPALDPQAYGVLGAIVNVPAQAIEPIPEGVSYEDAAAFWMAHGTAYGMTSIAGGMREGAGQTVLVTAASSSVGVAALQVIRAHGATSIATTRTQTKRQLLLDAGADDVIVTDEEDFVPRVMEITDGKGFDIACDSVNGEMLPLLAAAAGREATIVEMGLLSGEVATLPFFDMIGKGLNVSAFHLSWQMLHIPKRRAAAVAHLSERLREGTYKPVIAKVFDFGETPQAYAFLASNEQVGKVVVRFP